MQRKYRRGKSRMDSKQSQKAGANSQQMQAEVIHVHNGIDEKRAREIFSEMYANAKPGLTEEAIQLANTRVEQFEDSLIAKMSGIEGALDVFADPSFQFLLTSANKTAAATERIVDYDLLSELLIHRIEKGNERTTRAGINRAVEIVDDIADDALLGLTVSYSISQFSPNAGFIQQGLDILENLYSNLIYGELPMGQDWLDHLDILNAVRISPLAFGGLKKIEQYIPELLNGYVSPGMAKSSEIYKDASDKFRTVSLELDIFLVPHDLREGFFRIPVVSENKLDDLHLTTTLPGGKQLQKPLDEAQKKVVKDVYHQMNSDELARKTVVNSFMDEWKKRASLNKLREWWDNIPTPFSLTSVGRVLAHANAQRRQKDLPSFNP